MSKKTIYLAGGMAAFGKDNYDESNKWRTYFKNMFNSICSEKVITVNPNDHFSFADEFIKYETDREVMEYDLYRVRNADLIIANFNDPKSLGTMAEIAIAYEMKKPILGLYEGGDKSELHPWQQCMCSRIFQSKDEVVDYVIFHYISN